ncbi:MAG TPA: 5-oxoprolinase, partial [Gammaproteobacteria bacterium]|nr:5-oxoprolinase [Gammaproteobacteria bacterium]
DYPFQVPRAAEVYLDERWQSIPCMAFNRLRPGARITGPALLISDQFTLLIDSQFGGQVEDNGTLLLSRASVKADNAAETGGAAIGSCIKPESGQEQPDPITLEIYNHRFMGIAEQMGVTLQKTAHSVNMKERLDFSCAIFDRFGNLVANAPHIPVHLGAMGATIKALKSSANLQPGAVYASNHPASGGSHLPDVTVITPVFLQQQAQPHFFLASRGHHADIGGTTPGSMAPFSQKLQEEGVALNGLQLVADGIFLEESIRAHLTAGPWPARNIDERLADLRAQIAANRMGERELLRLLTDRGIGEVDRYMGFIQDNAAWAIDQVFRRLLGAQSQLQLSHHDQLDNGIAIA